MLGFGVRSLRPPLSHAHRANRERVVSDLESYLAFAKTHPQMFVNPPGAIFTILLDRDEIRQAEAAVGARLRAKGMPEEWASVGVAHRDQYMTIFRDAVRFPDGSLGTYFRFVDWGEGVPGVIVLPVYQGQVLLVRHFRHATRRWHLELPRGYGQEGRTPEENARRELAEEIGADISRLVLMGSSHPDAGASIEEDAFFYAEVAAYSKPDADEAIAEIVRVSVPEFERLMREDQITDGFTLTAYARAKLRGMI